MTDMEEKAGMVTLPGSKSIAARALVLDRVYGLGLRMENMPDCDDTRELSQALAQFPDAHEYNLGTGGTSLRFFTALAASTPGFYGRVDCSDALRRRPLAPLIGALRRAGADIVCENEEGRAPLLIKGKKLDGTGVEVDGSISSQFASALTMASGLWSSPLTTESSSVVSRPYLEMTMKMCAAFRKMEHGTTYQIEPDWSAASYFYEYALANPGRKVRISCLTRPEYSLQGDSACAAIFARLGVRTEITATGEAGIVGDAEAIAQARRQTFRLDMEETPDLVPAVVVGMCLAGISFELRGIANLRVKESDRIASLRCELGKAGYVLTAGPDTLGWHGERCAACEPADGGGCSRGGIIFDSHGDHRIAMSLAIALPRYRGARIAGAECVAKSFPDFFVRFERLLATD